MTLAIFPLPDPGGPYSAMFLKGAPSIFQFLENAKRVLARNSFTSNCPRKLANPSFGSVNALVTLSESVRKVRVSRRVTRSCWMVRAKAMREDDVEYPGHCLSISSCDIPDVRKSSTMALVFLVSSV